MSVINFGSELSLKEFAHAIQTVGRDVTIIGEGEPGIGKSAMLQAIATALPTLSPAYIDCTLLDLGDFALPYTTEEHGARVTRFAPNARFRLHEGRPVLIMLDEIGKAMKAVKNVLLTLMLEHRIGDCRLPEGSIVFGTTNLMSDGVGDMLEAHARNRVAFVKVRKPAADEWINDYALPHELDPALVAWVKQNPHCLASYTDESQKDNPYIFNPRRAGQNAFVTPRSLEKASRIASQRAILGDSLTISLMTGTVGESAARDMQAFFTVADKLPTWEGVIADPENAKLPDETIARCIFIFGALTRVQRESLTACMRYVQRMDMEWQALFATSILKSPAKQPFVVMNEAFRAWALKNHWVI